MAVYLVSEEIEQGAGKSMGEKKVKKGRDSSPSL